MKTEEEIKKLLKKCYKDVEKAEKEKNSTQELVQNSFIVILEWVLEYEV